MRAIDVSFYNEHLIQLILTCVFNPGQLGFDVNNEEINKKLPERVSVSIFDRRPSESLLDSQSSPILHRTFTRRTPPIFPNDCFAND
jgi:hypothetical protein